MKALLDTNFIMIPSEFGTDIYELLKFEGYDELVVLTPVKRELDKLGDKVAIELLEQQDYVLVQAEGGADDALLSYAKEHGGVVCTQDKTLKNRLKTLKIPVLTLRGRKVLRNG